MGSDNTGLCIKRALASEDTSPETTERMALSQIAQRKFGMLRFMLDSLQEAGASAPAHALEKAGL